MGIDEEKARVEKWIEISNNLKAIAALGEWVEEKKMDETKWEMGEWFMTQFDERQRKEILWALEYDQPNFRHGTNGHNDLLIIAKLARLLNEMEQKS